MTKVCSLKQAWVVLLALLVCSLMAEAPVQAQALQGVKVNVATGVYGNGNWLDAAEFSVFSAGIQRPLFGRFEAGVTVLYDGSGSGGKWPPMGEPLTCSPDGNLASLLKVSYPRPINLAMVRNRLELEPFLGLGANYSGGGEMTATSTDGSEENYEADTSVYPVVSYGMSASVRLNDYLDLTAQYIGLIHFAGKLGFTRASGARFSHDMGSFSTSNLFFGVAFNL